MLLRWFEQCIAAHGFARPTMIRGSNGGIRISRYDVNVGLDAFGTALRFPDRASRVTTVWALVLHFILGMVTLLPADSSGEKE